jgi:O-antigen/teichoic acid export membrane protein
VLARVLEPADFGAYRQLFLLYGTLYAIAQVGMAECLYYFLPRDREHAGRFAANSALMLGGVGLSLATRWRGCSATKRWRRSSPSSACSCASC